MSDNTPRGFTPVERFMLAIAAGVGIALLVYIIRHAVL